MSARRAKSAGGGEQPASRPFHYRNRALYCDGVALDALADPDALLNNTQEGPEQPEQIVERGTDLALVEQALLQLPMHLRAAATLRFIEGRSHPEIAEILNQPIGTVKSHVHRAVRILRRILGPQVGRIAPSEEPANAV